MATPPLKWHPLLAISEEDPGHWALHEARAGDADTRPPRKYGDIRLVRTKDGRKGYRCLMLARHMESPVDLGVAPTLRAACELVHHRWLSAANVRTAFAGYPDFRPRRGEIRRG